MSIAKAFANNDVVLLVWSYDNPIDDCLGFCIKRKEIQSGNEVMLESMVGFKKESISKRQFKPTNIWPIQKFNWRDFTAHGGDTYVYSIIPMIGKPDALKPMEEETLKTNQVTLSPGNEDFKAYFNRGILSTQFLSSEIPKGKSGQPNYKILLNRLQQVGDKLRNKLTDDLKDAVMSLIDLAIKEDGECFCALYELNDPELLAKLLQGGKRIHIVLSNTEPGDKTNEVARASLHDSKVDITDRFVAKGHIGHNKFVVYVDSEGKPSRVMTGSTNWTYTGLCAQSNNTIIVKSEELAQHYMEYWKRLKADDAKQSADFRTKNNHVRKASADGTDISLWFSPNTKQKSKPAKNPPIPGDMKQVFEAMNSANKSIIFLAFQPGAPSIIDEANKIQSEKPDLFIRGAVTDLKAADSQNVTLFHRGVREPVIVGAQALKDDFSYWMAEMLKSSPTAHAVIHDKVMVIDAFTDNCTVITGSHNLGYRASYNNDENMLIIKGNVDLATIYATHILDVYDHYRWRYFLSKNTGKGKRFEGLNTKPSWQDCYFNDKRGESIDKRFWL